MQLTPNIAAELAQHEGLVQRAYLDVGGVWTWGIGITEAAGFDVQKYRDTTAPVLTCLQVFAEVLRTRYLPPVLETFSGHPLTETQLGAALSFHYNTGAIDRAGWVQMVLDGQDGRARDAMLEWNKPPQVIPRRRGERDLFFGGTWTHRFEVPVLDVDADHRPDPATLRRVDMRAEFEALFPGA